MNAISRFGRALGRVLSRASLPWSDESWEAFHSIGQRTLSGVQITPDNALTITAVYCAINRISTDISCLPLRCYRQRKDGGRDEVRDTPHFELLNISPDGERTAMAFRRKLIAQTLGWGNGCCEIERTLGGQLYQLHQLTDGTKAERKSDKALYYRTPEGTELPPDRVVHVAGLGSDGINGYSPLRLHREACGIAKAAESFGASYYGNGMRTGGWIKLPATMKKEALDNFRESLRIVHGGPAAAHKVGFLEPGMDFVPTTIAPDEAQFLATRQFQVIEICRMFNIPPNKLMDLSNAHLANVEESNIDYMMTTLMPWCEAIEQAMNFRLFTPKERAQGFYVEHNMAAFLRGNKAAQAEYFTKMRDLGVYNVNEIRRLENLDPIGPEGDVRLVPLNMSSLANAGKPAPSLPKTNPTQA